MAAFCRLPPGCLPVSFVLQVPVGFVSLLLPVQADVPCRYPAHPSICGETQAYHDPSETSHRPFQLYLDRSCTQAFTQGRYIFAGCNEKNDSRKTNFSGLEAIDTCKALQIHFFVGFPRVPAFCIFLKNCAGSASYTSQSSPVRCRHKQCQPEKKMPKFQSPAPLIRGFAIFFSSGNKCPQTEENCHALT